MEEIFVALQPRKFVILLWIGEGFSSNEDVMQTPLAFKA